MTRKTADAGPGRARVLIVDDHPIVREGLALLISSQPGLAVCGEADDVATACRLVEETAPDVVVVDLSLKSSNGLDLIKRLAARHPAVRVLVSSIHDESLFAERALHAGAMGYVNKREATRSILDAIQRVLEGKVYLSAPMADRLLHRTVGGGGARPAAAPIEGLSDREMQVFELIGQGLTTHQVAEKMHLSPKTVETYRDRIRKKLALNSSAEVTRHALRWVMEDA